MNERTMDCPLKKIAYCLALGHSVISGRQQVFGEGARGYT